LSSLKDSIQAAAAHKCGTQSGEYSTTRVTTLHLAGRRGHLLVLHLLLGLTLIVTTLLGRRVLLVRLLLRLAIVTGIFLSRRRAVLRLSGGRSVLTLRGVPLRRRTLGRVALRRVALRRVAFGSLIVRRRVVACAGLRLRRGTGVGGLTVLGGRLLVGLVSERVHNRVLITLRGFAFASQLHVYSFAASLGFGGWLAYGSDFMLIVGHLL
jgi:hypothetical protein